MKKFILLEILLCSLKEKKAKKVQFDPKRTIIYGKNDTGKSSLIKSIYQAFGATAKVVHPNWNGVKPTILVKFEIDGIRYSIVKDDKNYAIFDSNNTFLKSFSSVTKGLGPYLAELFNFKIELPDKSGTIIVPPPSFIFLPFYIDQDASWSNTWDGFGNLQQIKNYREPIILYHTGIRPNEYYDAKNKQNIASIEIAELELEKKTSKEILGNLTDKISGVDFNMDFDQFREEVTELVLVCEELKKKEISLKSKIIDLHNEKHVIEEQIEIVKAAHQENQKDYSYANMHEHNSVECPTCGAEYENSFSERFEIAKDVDRCHELLAELNEDYSVLIEKLAKESTSLNKTTEEVIKIEDLLSRKKGEIELRDIIENAGRNEVKSLFDKKIKEITEKIFEKKTLQSTLADKIKSLENKKRKEDILNEYRFLMKLNLNRLEVNSLADKDYQKITGKIKDTGSSKIRSFISYYFAIFQIIKKYSSSTFCPLIIDSPNQQAQDKDHINAILDFINGNQPPDTQMILGLEDLYNIDFKGEIVELKEKNSLLQSSEFEEVFEEIRPFKEAIYKSKGMLF